MTYSINEGHTNTWTASQQFQINNIGTVSTDGIILQNLTAATTSNPIQYSPSLHFKGTILKTGAATASQVVEVINYTTPVSNGATPLVSHIWQAIINGGAPINLLSLAYNSVTTNLSVGGGIGVLTAGTGNISTVSAITTTIASKLNITTGTNRSAGTASLVSGQVTIATTQVLSASMVYVSYRAGVAPSIGIGSIGTLMCNQITNGATFSAVSLTSANLVNTTDNSQIQWLIIT